MSLTKETKEVDEKIDSPGKVLRQPQKLKSQKQLVMSVAAVLIILACVTGTVVVLAAEGIGKNKPWSKLSALIPAEKIKLLEKFRKSNAQLVADAITDDLNPDHLKRIGGQENEETLKFEIKAAQTRDIPAFSGELNATTTMSRAADGVGMTSHSSINGQFSSGVFTFDTGKDGLKLDLIIPNRQDFYGKLELSDKMKQTWESVMAASGDQSSTALMNQYLNRYLSVNLLEYQSFITSYTQIKGQPGQPAALDPQKAQKILKEFEDKFYPDALTFEQNAVGNLFRNAKIDQLARQKIAGQESLVFGVELSKAQMVQAIPEIVQGYIVLLKKYRTDLVNYCEAVTPVSIQPPDCAEQVDTMFENLEKQLTAPENKTLFNKNLEKAFDLFNVSDLKLYISPVDNSLLKSEFTVQADLPKLQVELGFSAPKIEKLELHFSQTEVSRGKTVKIEAPKDALNLITEIKKLLEENRNKTTRQLDKLNKPRTQPLRNL